MREAKYRVPSKLDWRTLIGNYLNNALYIGDDAPEELRDAERNSQAVGVIKKFLRLAQQQCIKDGLEPDDPDAISRMDEAFDIGRDFAFSAHGYMSSAPISRGDTPEKIRRARSLTYWAEPRTLEYEIKSNGRLMVDFSQYEAAVIRYLESDLRSAEIDRFILTGLIDMELTGFLERVYKRDPITRVLLDELIKKSIPKQWLKGRVNALVLSILITVITFYTTILWEAAPNWVSTAGYGVAIGQFVLTSLIATIALPFAASAHKKAIEPLKKLIDGMTTFYWEIHSDGPLSLRHVRLRIEDLRDIDAIWPGSIWVLLEDIEKRGVTTL